MRGEGWHLIWASAQVEEDMFMARRAAQVKETEWRPLYGTRTGAGVGRLRQQRKAPVYGGPHGRTGAPSSGPGGPLKAWSQGVPSDLCLLKGDFWLWRMVGASLAAGSH